MRPDKRKKNRGRNSEKTEGNVAQQRKVEENVANNSESAPSSQKETEKSEVVKPVKVEETAEKAKTDLPLTLNLRRETDELKETKKFSKRQIFSNWDKYDEPIVPEEEDEIHDDFGSLIQRNFSGDEHFKFKFQQQWENESCSINQDLFTLNLERLSSGLSCIPYYKRLNLPMDLFSEDELQKMQDDAKAKVKDYDNILKGEPVAPVTASLLGKLKECLEDQVANETVKNINENDEMTMPGLGDSSTDGYACPEEAVWDLDQNQKETQLVTDREMKNDQIIQSGGKIGIEEDTNTRQESEMKIMEEKMDVSNLDPPERIEVEKEQRKKRPSNRRREAANRSSNKIEQSNDLLVDPPDLKSTITDRNTVEQSNDLPVNAADVKSKNNEFAFKEEVLKKVEGEKAIVMTPMQEIKNALPKTEPKVETSACNERISSSSHPLKKPILSGSTEKTRVEEDDELDSLLSLKEPSLPQFNLNHKAQDDEHEMENLAANVSSIVIHEKKENLEEWLDSMLDD